MTRRRRRAPRLSGGARAFLWLLAAALLLVVAFCVIGELEVDAPTEPGLALYWVVELLPSPSWIAP